MPLQYNKAFDADVLADYKRRIGATGNNFLIEETDENNNEECVHFYFVGKHESKEVIYDAVMYTLRLHHES